MAATHRPLEDPKGVGADKGGEVGRAVQTMHGKVLAADEAVAGRVAGRICGVAEGKGKPEQVEAQCGGTGIDQDEHCNVAGKACAHTSNGNLHAVCTKNIRLNCKFYMRLARMERTVTLYEASMHQRAYLTHAV